MQDSKVMGLCALHFECNGRTIISQVGHIKTEWWWWFFLQRKCFVDELKSEGGRESEREICYDAAERGATRE